MNNLIKNKIIYLIRISIFIISILSILIAEDFILEGVILDSESLTPLESVNISINESDIGTTSNEVGYFSISTNLILPITLSISHVGYETLDVNIKNEEKIEIYLTPKIILMDDVIIEGVQRHSEREISSKIEVVELKSIEERGIRDIGELLNEFEGVNISTTSYGKQTISVRGSNSNEVAVYLDGIKLNNSATGSADLAYVDLTDLDEVEVIKGGSSTLFGAGNFGGVVLLHSIKPQFNSFELNTGYGLTDNNDKDLSTAATINLGPIGLYGRYSGKSRLFDGRTLFTSIFGNYGGLISLNNQELAYRHVEYDKYIKFPSGSIVSSDELVVDRVTFFGNILNTTGWDIQFGYKDWSWDDDFYSNVSRNFSDKVTQYRINKGFQFNEFSGSLQIEQELQDYVGNQLIQDSYSSKSWRSVGTLTQQDKGIAGIFRYDVRNPVSNISVVRWEGGIRFSRASYSQNQIVQNFEDGSGDDITDDDIKNIINLSTYKLGVLARGDLDNFSYQLFVNQGFNNRLPTLNDRFLSVEGINQLQDYYKRLNLLYYKNGNPVEIKDKLIKIKSILDLSDEELQKELVNNSEINIEFYFNNLKSDIFNSLTIGAGLFRNNYLNKIAYLPLDNNNIIPYNTNNAWLNGFEINTKLSALNDLLLLTSNITLVHPSDQEIFPNKPSSSGSILLDIRGKWFYLNVSHIFNGPQNYLHGGVSIEQLQKQKNTNLTLSVHSQFWYFNTTLSYTIRNIFSDDVTILTAGTQTGDVFNYYDAHRQLINLKISLADNVKDKK